MFVLFTPLGGAFLVGVGVLGFCGFDVVDLLLGLGWSVAVEVVLVGMRC